MSIATNILNENPATQEPELRKWAVAMLDSNSPIPFSGKAKEGLVKGIYFAVAPPRMPGLPESCMKPPRPARIQPLVHKMSKEKIASTAELARQYDKFLQVAVTSEAEAMEDRIALECLQKYGKLVNQWTDEIAAMHTKPVSLWPAASSASTPGSAP